jgi:arsenate reductase-like glutaredoxin family protein
LRKEGVETSERDLAKKPLTAAEVDSLIGSRDYLDFLNPRNELYRKRGFKEQPPTRAQAVKLIAQEPNLLRRPLIIEGKTILFGFDEPSYAKLAKKK